MPGTPAVGTGTILTLGSGIVFTVFRLSYAMDGLSLESIETTHMASTLAKSFIASDLYDPGTLTVEFQLDAETPLTTMDTVAAMDGTVDTWLITMQATGNFSGNGFIKEVSWNYPLEELTTGTMVIQCTGVIATAN